MKIRKLIETSWSNRKRLSYGKSSHKSEEGFDNILQECMSKSLEELEISIENIKELLEEKLDEKND